MQSKQETVKVSYLNGCTAELPYPSQKILNLLKISPSSSSPNGPGARLAGQVQLYLAVEAYRKENGTPLLESKMVIEKVVASNT